MISNERPSPYGPRSESEVPGKSFPVEENIRKDEVQIERKTFVFTLKENARGRFLRITEDVNGRRDAIIIPATGLEEVRKILEQIILTSNETPAKAATA